MSRNTKIIILISDKAKPFVFDGKEKTFTIGELTAIADETPIFKLCQSPEGYSIIPLTENIDIHINEDLLFSEYTLKENDRIFIADYDISLVARYSTSMTVGGKTVILPSHSTPVKSKAKRKTAPGEKKVLGMTPTVGYIAIGMIVFIVIIFAYKIIAGPQVEKMPYVVFNARDKEFLKENPSFYMLDDLSGHSFLKFEPRETARIEGKPTLEDSAAAFNAYSNVMLGLQSGTTDFASLLRAYDELVKCYGILSRYSVRPPFFDGLLNEIENVRTLAITDYETTVRRCIMLYSEAIRTDDKDARAQRIREAIKILSGFMSKFPENLKKDKTYVLLAKLNGMINAYAQSNRIKLTPMPGN